MTRRKKHLTVSELLRMACIYAQQDRETFIEAWNFDETEPVVRESKAFLKQLVDYRKKRWGLTAYEAFSQDAERRQIFVDDIAKELAKQDAAGTDN